MAIVNGYCTEAQLQAALKRAVSASDPNYTLIQDAITRASRLIDQRTSTIYYTKALTSEKVDQYEVSDTGLYISGNGSTLWFPAPVISITSIVEDGTTLVSGTDYFLYKTTGKIVRVGGWTTTQQGISVTGSIGLAAIPSFVEQWCIAIAEALTGLAVSAVVDDSGSQIEVIKNSIPKWVWNDMKSNQRTML